MHLLFQSYASIKLERDTLKSDLQEVETSKSNLSSKSLSLELELVSTRDQLFNVEAEYKRLSEEKLKYIQQAETLENATSEVKEQLAQATSTTTSMMRQLQHTQTELRSALRRAEDAESLQQSLQTEGTNLMRSLDEMRPKIVELTDARLDLSERVETLESAVRIRDLTITQLENELNESRNDLEQSKEYGKDTVLEQERRVAEAEKVIADIQRGYVELQEEHDVLLVSLRNLEVERSNNHQEASRHLQEIDQLSHMTQLQEEQLEVLKHELEAIKKSYVKFLTYRADIH